jgi:hypothetical protein
MFSDTNITMHNQKTLEVNDVALSIVDYLQHHYAPSTTPVEILLYAMMSAMVNIYSQNFECSLIADASTQCGRIFQHLQKQTGIIERTL